jgi:hypothetical protein
MHARQREEWQTADDYSYAMFDSDFPGAKEKKVDLIEASPPMRSPLYSSRGGSCRTVSTGLARRRVRVRRMRRGSMLVGGDVLLRISQCQSGSQLSCSLVYSPSGGQRGGKRQRRCCAQSSERLGLRTSMSHKRPRGSYYAGQLVRGAGMVEWSDGIPGSRTRRQSTCSTRPSWIYTAAPQGPAMGRPVDLSRQTRTLPGGT